MDQRGIKSMRELSLKAKLNETLVRSIMNGNSISPRGITIKALAHVLGVSPMDLLGQGSSEKKAPGEFVEDSDELALLGFWRALDRVQKMMVLKMIAAIAPKDVA